MKKILLGTILIGATLSASAQKIGNVINQATSILNGSGVNLSNGDIVSGLKEALTVGAKNSSLKASAFNGFYQNPLIKIPFPKEAKVMEDLLIQAGMKKQVENFTRTLNRAAEDAAKDAAPIFLAAITSMNISDGLSILKGGDNAATEFLKGKTIDELKAKFSPVIQSSLKKVNITKYWNPLITKYNKIPMVQKMNPNLDDYVTTKALEGLFKLVAEEELKIRKDPGARVSDLLKKVFG
ncbi:MAG TPA: DUF4197 domain-containing protein [Bacteroidia bacterium]|nr:DUF4197 domain-containing protein [Bacteroidia bacterium]HRH09380.1 DUF4197 domain-containing protein [Bacteroidia bacterium]